MSEAPITRKELMLWFDHYTTVILNNCARPDLGSFDQAGTFDRLNEFYEESGIPNPFDEEEQ